ncbi:Abi family protein [Staphylococcus gallinarum]|uniref:Abi family protein n=1 Tax=Staphylococcus gallinarum TaxID=1293 RepID=UPI001E4E9708|nr:Abi family protein [Staphylococcus gallinarum]MCD8843563.1 Abi family protein [Staphylococcus gallinarum]
MKPFKTHNQQLKILRERGLEVPSERKRDLENENYYNIINGYKDLFLRLNSNKEPEVPEAFIEGTHFDEIFSLYKLDRKLRNNLLEYLLVFETQIKSRIAYYFSEKYQEPHSYLYFKNYSNDPNKTDSIVQTVASLSNIMSNRKNEPLKHYINTHNGVPLWILVNYLSLGTISKMYSNLDDDLRKKIALDFKTKFKREYKIALQIEPNDIDSILQQAHLFRNVCAHEERLYDFKVKKPKKRNNIFSNYNKSFNKNFTQNVNTSSIFDLLISLSHCLNKRDYIQMINKLDKIFKHYDKNIKNKTLKEMYKKMKFPSNVYLKDLL